MLGVFSLPEGGAALNLRRERQSLVSLINQVAATGRAANVKVLQYGVTRARLCDVLEDGEGWDIIHISGHGVPGQLVLETADGRPDRITAEDLADLLDLARDRVKLVTVSACWSAAHATAEPRRLLGLETREKDHRHFDGEPTTASPPSQPPAPGDIATTLASRLGCAVLAMRFPVGDEFAIELATKLYELLTAEGQPLPSAVGITLKRLGDRPAEEWFPALSMVAPAIFGATAPGLTLKAPPCTISAPRAAERPKMADDFPPQTERFVGRTAVMTRASAALAPDSGISGVLFHGMPGGGKTACALELGHTHEDAFDKLIWFRAPDESVEISGSLTNFALTLERNLPGLEVIDKVVADETLTSFLLKLTELMDRNRLLIVIDNAESLLTDTGQWRDDMWGAVVSALTTHTGLGRIILTTRRVPAQTRGFRVESVDALSADETLLLTRELPRLRTLISGKLDGLDKDAARNLALGVLNVAQGHPKLLELADGQAAHPEHLTALLQTGGHAWQEHGTLPNGFFATGKTSVVPGDYLRVLAAWTNVVTDNLSPGARDLFWFLCCLEEPDRLEAIIDGCWPAVWQRLSRNGRPPNVNQALSAITTSGLAAKGDGPNNASPLYAIHPGLAAAGRAQAGFDFQTTVDTEAAGLWIGMFQMALEANITKMLVHSGLAASPYLTRQGQWTRVAALLDSAFAHEPSRANAAAALRAVQPIAAHAPEAAALLARVQMALNPVGNETQTRAAMQAAASRGDYQAAAVAAGSLLELYRLNGQLAKALELADQRVLYTRKASLGPWTQLGDEIERLQVLNAMGRAGEVLAEVQQLRTRAETLPASPSGNELSEPWEIRELLFDTGAHAAFLLQRWQDALAMNSARADSLNARAASAIEVARTRFNTYFPLVQLGRVDEAFDLLLECQQDFQHAGEVREIGRTFSALGEVEAKRGHGYEAIRLERSALRYTYTADDVPNIAVSYQNLGNYLDLHAGQPARALPCHLMTALIHRLMGVESEDPDAQYRDIVIDLRRSGGAAATPNSIADLCRALGDIPGTDPAALVAKLSPDPTAAERTLEELIDVATWIVRLAQARDSK